MHFLIESEYEIALRFILDEHESPACNKLIYFCDTMLFHRMLDSQFEILLDVNKQNLVIRYLCGAEIKSIFVGALHRNELSSGYRKTYLYIPVGREGRDDCVHAHIHTYLNICCGNISKYHNCFMKCL